MPPRLWWLTEQKPLLSCFSVCVSWPSSHHLKGLKRKPFQYLHTADGFNSSNIDCVSIHGLRSSRAAFFGHRVRCNKTQFKKILHMRLKQPPFYEFESDRSSTGHYFPICCWQTACSWILSSTFCARSSYSIVFDSKQHACCFDLPNKFFFCIFLVNEVWFCVLLPPTCKQNQQGIQPLQVEKCPCVYRVGECDRWWTL